jgi:hypothetical protein
MAFRLAGRIWLHVGEKQMPTRDVCRGGEIKQVIH